MRKKCRRSLNKGLQFYEAVNEEGEPSTEAPPPMPPSRAAPPPPAPSRAAPAPLPRTRAAPPPSKAAPLPPPPSKAAPLPPPPSKAAPLRHYSRNPMARAVPTSPPPSRPCPPSNTTAPPLPLPSDPPQQPQSTTSPVQAPTKRRRLLGSPTSPGSTLPNPPSSHGSSHIGVPSPESSTSSQPMPNWLGAKHHRALFLQEQSAFTTGNPALVATSSHASVPEVQETPPYGCELISARTGKTASEEAILPNFRGVNYGARLEKEIRARRYKRMDFLWDPLANQPEGQWRTSFVGYLGSVIRDKISMKAETWWQVDLNSLKRMDSCLKVFFVLEDNPLLHDWMNNRAYDIYRDWKYALHLHYLENNHKGRDGTPFEFQHRESEWQWLCDHFRSPKYMRRSVANTHNRGEMTENHHGGSRSYADYFEDAQRNGAQIPAVKVYIDTHPDQPQNIAKLKTVADSAILQKAKRLYPDIPEEDLPLSEITITDIEGQALVMNTAFPSKLGYYVKGLGPAGEGILTKLKVSPRCSSATTEAMEAAKKATKALEIVNERLESSAKASDEKDARMTKMMETMQGQISVLTAALMAAVTASPAAAMAAAAAAPTLLPSAAVAAQPPAVVQTADPGEEHEAVEAP